MPDIDNREPRGVPRRMQPAINDVDGCPPGGYDTASLGAIEAAMLRQTFPQWWIFQNSGTWWAMRGGLQVWDGPRALLLRVITAPDLTVLADRLCLQEWIDRLDDDALEAVYRGDVMEARSGRVGGFRAGGRRNPGLSSRLAGAAVPRRDGPGVAALRDGRIRGRASRAQWA